MAIFANSKTIYFSLAISAICIISYSLLGAGSSSSELKNDCPISSKVESFIQLVLPCSKEFIVDFGKISQSGHIEMPVCLINQCDKSIVISSITKYYYILPLLLPSFTKIIYRC
jgi:hypothetical protein